MSELYDSLLVMVLTYGHWAVAFITLLGGIGIPVPSTMILLAAGAFIQQGVLNSELALLLALGGAVAGDNISYFIGRLLGASPIRRYKESSAWQRASQFFSRWGAWGIFLSRFLITPLALPINLMAGSTGYQLYRYASIVFAGELVWVLIYIGAGYWFTDQWEIISSMMSNLSGMLVAIVFLLVSGVLLFRRLRNRGPDT